MENIFQQTSTNYDILINLSPLSSSPFEPATIKRAISPPPSHLYFLKNWRKKKKKRKGYKSTIRFTTCRNCTLFRWTIYDVSSRKEYPGILAPGAVATYRLLPCTANLSCTCQRSRSLWGRPPPPCSSPRDGNHPRRGIHFKGRKFRRRKRSLRLYPRKGWAVIKGRFRPRGCSSRSVPMP